MTISASNITFRNLRIGGPFNTIPYWNMAAAVDNYAQWYDVVWAGDRFVSVGIAPADHLPRGRSMSSTDGTTWTETGRTYLDLAPPAYQGLCYGNGILVAFTSNYTTATASYSLDKGVTWANVATWPTGGVESMVFAYGKFWAIIPGTQSMNVSTDGINWINQSHNLGYYSWYTSGFDGTRMVLVSQEGNTGYTDNGIAWHTSGTTPQNNGNWSQLAYGNGTWVSAPYGSNDYINYSTDGAVTWQQAALPHPNVFITSVVFSMGHFLLTNLYGTVCAKSVDGITWIDAPAMTPNGSYWRLATNDNGLYVGVQPQCPIVAVGTIAEPSRDPYFADVKYLLHMDGANGYHYFHDYSQYNWTVVPYVNRPYTDTSQKKFGISSMNINGSDLYVPYNSAITIGTQDFTMEGWTYFTNLYSWAVFMGQEPRDSGISNRFWLGNDTTDLSKIAYWLNGNNLYLSASGVLTTGQWYHIAMSRESGTSRVFVNGIQAITFSDSTDYNATTNWWFGSGAGGGEGIDGFTDEQRLTVGVSRYNANFTPPTAPFPNYGP